MLLYYLIESQNQTPQDPVATGARNFSWNTVMRLKNNRHEVQPLIASMTTVCGRFPAHAIQQWTTKVEAMPEHFYFTNNSVVYREYTNGGVLMVAECQLVQPMVQNMGRVENARIILNLIFFVKANPAESSYDVYCIPPAGPQADYATQKFGNDFLQMMAQMNTPLPKSQTVPLVPEEKKSWWKKITGK